MRPKDRSLCDAAAGCTVVYQPVGGESNPEAIWKDYVDYMAVADAVGSLMVKKICWMP